MQSAQKHRLLDLLLMAWCTLLTDVIIVPVGIWLDIRAIQGLYCLPKSVVLRHGGNG
jgi:hypothetical protein